MNKIKLTLLALLLLPLMQVAAISDQDVIQTAMTLYSQGMGEQEIAKELLRRGATIDQLQRISEQVGDSRQSAGTQSVNVVNVSSDAGMRQNNGEVTIVVDANASKSGVFGHDIFRTQSASFLPNANQPTPMNYTLGAGDEVIIDIFGATQLNLHRTISPDGTIVIEGYGPVNLAGLSIADATRRLKNTIGKRYQGNQIMLSLGQTRTITVNIMGEVTIPGSHQLSAFANVMNALYTAGGITDRGTLREIRIYRQNQLLSEIDLYSYLMDGNLDGDVRLTDGDVIIVNTYGARASISGNVKRPMTYELKQGETLERLLYYAGGFSAEAYTDAIRISRNNDGAPSVHTVRNADFAAFRLMDGDAVEVAAILPRLKNTVEIQGAVFRPGYYGLDENVKTVRSLVAAADGLSEDAVLARAALYRMQLDRTYLTIAIDLKGILDGTVQDIELRNEDQLFIPSKKNELERMKVTIHGEVYNPATYTYAYNESVEDLILRAGGLTERAARKNVGVARRVIDPNATEESQIKTQLFSVDLSDSLGINEHGFMLEPYDEVFVRMSPAFGRQMNVRIQGEVVFEGTYTMKTKDDRLSDLVAQAGGLNSHAFVAGARLQRRMTQEERYRRDQLLKINRAASSRDSVDTDKLDISDVYWVGIDLAAAIAHPGSDEDITLREGDVLIVPTMNHTVKIHGEVLYPNTVSYINGKNARYYINQAGGFSNRARRGKAYIIYANGKVHPTCGGKVRPGCEIVVPGKPERERASAAQWVSIASASASLASVAATLTTLIISATRTSGSSSK